MRYSIALAALSGQLIGALVPPLPLPTQPGIVNIQGFTPKPTNAPDMPLWLRRRAGNVATSATGSFIGWLAPDNTCGYVEGSIGASKTCDNTQICAALDVEGTATMGCCDTAQEGCTFLGACVNSVGFYSSSLCGNECQQDVNTVKCTDATKPYCFSYTISDMSAYWFSCASVSGATYDAFQTTFLGETDGRTWKPIYDTASASSSGVLGGGLPFSSSGGGGGGAASSTSHSSSSVSPSPTGGHHNSTNVGAIAGGVVGGLAVIGIAVFGVVFLLLRRRRNNQPPAAAAAATAAPTGPSAGPGPDMSQQQSMYGAPPGYNPNHDPNRASVVAGGYYDQHGGKHDYVAQQGYVPQQEYAHHQADGAGKFGGVQDNIQPAPTSPGAPGSPPSPYPPHANIAPSPVGSPPPQQLHSQPQQPYHGQPQFGSAQQPAELGTQHAYPVQNAQGAPIFEAPAEAPERAPAPS